MSSIANGNGVGIGGSTASSLVANRGQMDINMLYQKIIELGSILKENREKHQGIVSSAEEFATRNGPDRLATLPPESAKHGSSAAELRRENLELHDTKELLLREQRENNKLLGEYENAIGEILEKIRNIAFEKEGEKVRAIQDYNASLQEEKDAHLRTRLERDEWHSRFLQGLEMLRKAHQLRSEEDEEPIRVIGGLQNEIRGYRHALGLEPESPEDECGYRYLKSS